MRRRRRIAIVTDSVLPYHNGGKEIRTEELTRRLAGRVDVTVFTMRWWGAPRSLIRDGVRFESICPVYRLYVGDRRSLLQAIRFGIACLRLSTRTFDVIDADQIPFLPLFTLKLVAVIRRRRLIVTWHEVWDTAYWREYLGLVGLVAAALSRLAVLLPDEILAASPESAERLRPLVRHGTRITVVPNGIDLARVRAAPVAEAGADIISVGRLIRHKGAHLLVEAIALLRQRGVVVTALLIGTGPEADRLHEQVRSLDLHDAVTIRGDVETPDDVYGLLKASRVFVLPSTREGFGIAVLEALACGLPVVTADHPDNMARHLARRSGRGIVVAANAMAVAEGIELALAMHAERAGDRDFAAQYDWDAVAADVLEAYLR